MFYNIPYFYTNIQHQQVTYQHYQSQATLISYPFYNVAPSAYYTTFNNDVVCGQPQMSYQTFYYPLTACHLHYVPQQYSQIIPNTKQRKYAIPIINPDSLKIQPPKSLINKDIFTQTDKIKVKSVSVQTDKDQIKDSLPIAEESLKTSTETGGKSIIHVNFFKVLTNYFICNVGCCKINRKGAKRKEKYKKILKKQQKRSNKLLA